MSKKKKQTDRPADKSFEQSLAELQQIVEQLEQGKLGLSESIEKYERGVKLLRECHHQLQQVERKIQVLTRVDEDGQAHVENLGDQPTAAEFGTSDRARKRGYSSDVEEKPAEIDDEGRLF